MNKLFDSLPYDSLAGMKKTNMILAGLLVGGLIFGAYWFTLHATAEETIAAHEKKTTELDGTFKQYQQQIAQKPELERQIALLSAEFVERKRLLPMESVLPGLLHRVTDIGTVLGIQIADFKIGSDISKVEFYREVPMTVKINGGFYNTLGFFDWLQNLLQVVEVKGLSMATTKIKKPVVDEKSGKQKLKPVESVQTTIDASIYALVENGG